eukprot:scaffold1007_cov364-Prasinococcus_capsulatus_cf.AAC.10
MCKRKCRRRPHQPPQGEAGTRTPQKARLSPSRTFHFRIHVLDCVEDVRLRAFQACSEGIRGCGLEHMRQVVQLGSLDTHAFRRYQHCLPAWP